MAVSLVATQCVLESRVWCSTHPASASDWTRLYQHHSFLGRRLALDALCSTCCALPRGEERSHLHFAERAFVSEVFYETFCIRRWTVFGRAYRLHAPHYR